MAYIRKKKDNAYLITVSCGRDSTGKKITRSVTFRPELLTAKGNQKSETAIQKEVNAYAADFEKKVLTGHYTEGHNMTFEEYSRKYLAEYAELNQAPRTLESTRAAVRLFVSAFGYMTLENLSPLYLQEYVNHMLNTRKTAGKPGTLSQGTVKRRAAVLSAMLSQAVRWNLIESNPMDRVQVKKAAPAEEKPLCFTRAQAETFLSILDQPLVYEYGQRCRKDRSGNIRQIQEYQADRSVRLQLKLFFYLAMFTGCRRGELIAITWNDLDFTEGSISITKSACRVNGETIIKSTKTRGSNRLLSVPAVVMDVARRWKKEQAAYRLSIGTKWDGNDNVFIQWNGVQMCLDTPYQAFHRIIRNYNAQRPDGAPELPLIPLHGLRHTAATLLIGQGVDIRTVSGRLGHASTSTTLNIYSHALKELDRAASDKLEEALIRSIR